MYTSSGIFIHFFTVDLPLSAVMEKHVNILSGGLSTELEAAGFMIQGDPLWSARLLKTNPQAIKNVHASFLKSGADVLTTATYQASVEGFQKSLDLNVDEAAELFHVGVRLAREAAEEFNAQSPVKKNVIIAGSIGPYGAFLHDGSEYTGNYVTDMTIEDLKNWHRQQMRCLAMSGIDLFAFETIPSQKEAEALVLLLREFPNLKAWLSYSCKDISSTSYGDKFKEAVKIGMGLDQLVAVGVNCCAPNLVSPLLMSANQNQDPKTGWIVYPNTGEEWNHEFGWQGRGAEKHILDSVQEWINLGAKWIGGCCRTTPSDIESLRQCLRPAT
ncbi:homocysteine S-methyltransferase 1-like isoform X4 [Pelobates cultripes]|uniref:Homocysteine S-methyltransferase 1-like isoform X4 n=2 Tax=Pelobates cultripes TaxID=61616 RepID=A0AAD1R4J1_PELCU|nr:homocysteine S-methyltransferase 1-like isoform X4 [Pelobates cultripes]